MRRVVLDQGLPSTTAPMLRELGCDAIHVREIGMRDAEDVAILDFAVRESRVLITLDHDFPQFSHSLRRP